MILQNSATLAQNILHCPHVAEHSSPTAPSAVKKKNTLELAIEYYHSQSHR